MSAFSNFNGPDNCHGGPALPQITTLEQLMQRINNLQQLIRGTVTDLTAHVTDSNLVTLHPTLQVDYNSKINQARSDLEAAYTEADRQLKQLIDAQLGIGTVDSRINSAVNIEKDRAEAVEDTLSDAINTETAARAAADDAISGILTSYATAFTTDILTLNRITSTNNFIDVLKDLQTLRIRPTDLIDFTQWYTVHAQAVPAYGVPVNTNLPGAGTNPTVLLLGYLSEETWRNGSIATEQVFKAATAYLKFVNTLPWNAIVDMTATVRSSPDVAVSSTDWKGTISAQVSKTTDRGVMRFGLYRDSTSSGKYHIYLGVMMQEAFTTANAGTYISGIDVRVAGINFIPLEDDKSHWAASGVVEITGSSFTDSGFAFDRIAATEFESDKYLDSAGAGVMVTTHSPTDFTKGTLTLGDATTPKQLIINSENRPVVQHVDGGRHLEAYLDDLAGSVMWQREAMVVADTLNQINSTADVYMVWVNVAAGATATDANIVGPASPNAISQRPGIYLSEPSIESPAGHLFVTNDPPALIRDSNQTQALVDGMVGVSLTTTASATTTVPLTAFTHLDTDHIKVGTANAATVDGTTVEDADGTVGKVTAVANGNATVMTIWSEATKPANWESYLFRYTKPAYATFDGTRWVLGDVIDIPGTFDGYVHDLTYEWSAYHAVANRSVTDEYFIMSYATWTAHHENTSTMTYNGDAWSYTDLVIAGFRDAVRQDEIDDYIEALASVQADYGENRPTITFTRPEQLPKTIANPAYIQHKPWAGVGVLDAGSFKQPSDMAGWLVDGGDFTGISGNVPPNVASPAVSPSQQFANVVMRIWHGNYADMPEVTAPVGSGIWSTYARTLRWTDDTKELYINDGNSALYKFITVPATGTSNNALASLLGLPAGVVYTPPPATGGPYQLSYNRAGNQLGWV